MLNFRSVKKCVKVNGKNIKQKSTILERLSHGPGRTIQPYCFISNDFPINLMRVTILLVWICLNVRHFSVIGTNFGNWIKAMQNNQRFIQSHQQISANWHRNIGKT